MQNSNSTVINTVSSPMPTVISTTPKIDPILEYIRVNEIVNEEDYSFLLRVWSEASLIDKFKIRSYLQLSQISSLLTLIQVLKIRFPEPKKTGIFDRINQVFNKENKLNKVLAPSILSDPKVFGNNFPQPMSTVNIEPLGRIDSINNILQLGILNSSQIDLPPNQDENVVLTQFYTKIDNMMEAIPDLFQRKSILATYLQSPLYISYINTALTAFKHPEIEPRKVVLNLLHSANNNFLSNKQFEIASAITSHIRFTCGY